jgi:hypothetical protein
MINAPPDNNPAGTDPFKDPYEDQLNYSSYYKMMADTQAKVADLLETIKNYSERQREKNSPTIIDLSPSSGTPIGQTFSTYSRLRIIGFLLTGGAGDQFQLSFGARHFHFYNVTGAPVFITFPYEIDRGIDINMTDLTAGVAGLAWSCYLFGYTE